MRLLHFVQRTVEIIKLSLNRSLHLESPGALRSMGDWYASSRALVGTNRRYRAPTWGTMHDTTLKQPVMLGRELILDCQTESSAYAAVAW